MKKDEMINLLKKLRAPENAEVYLDDGTQPGLPHEPKPQNPGFLPAGKPHVASPGEKRARGYPDDKPMIIIPVDTEP